MRHVQTVKYWEQLVLAMVVAVSFHHNAWAGEVPVEELYPVPPPEESQPDPPTQSYAPLLLAMDAVNLALFSLSPQIRPTAFLLPGIGMGGYFLTAPIIHLSHGRGWRALGSFGLRTGMLLLTTTVAGDELGEVPGHCSPMFSQHDEEPEDPKGSWCDPDKVSTWGLVAFPAGMLLDDLILTDEPITPSPTKTTAYTLQPRWSPRTGSLRLVFVGVF
jgi:hypothetical protein